MTIGLVAGSGTVVEAQDHGSGLADDRVTLDPAKAITQYRHDVWTTLDGLPQNSVFALEQTPDGYLWVGTQEGLARFDGTRFVVYDRSHEPALQVNNVNRMLVDRAGTLWLATRGGGLVRYRAGSFTAFTQTDGLASDFATSLAEDRAGALWIGTYEGGLSRYADGAFTTFGPEAGLDARFVSHVLEDRAGRLWVGTEQGLYERRGDRFVHTDDATLATAYVSTLYEDAHGALWVGTRDGHLYSLRDGALTAHPLPLTEPGTYVKALLEDSEGTLWVGAVGGLFRYRAGRFDPFTMDQGLSNDAVFVLKEDREGALWIGTQDGLNRFQDGKFTTLTPSEGLPNKMALSVYEDADGALWVATQEGLARIRDGRVRTFTTDDGLPSNSILAVHGAYDGGVWVGTQGGGATLLREGRARTFTTDDGLAGNTIFAVYPDRSGHTWFATDAGVSIYDGGTFTTLPPDALGTPYATAFLEASNGAFWIGTYDTGLVRVDGAGENRTYTALRTEDGLPSDAVLTLHEDARGALWIGTMEGGLARYRDGQFDRYTLADGLPSNSILALLSTDDALWMSSNRGIAQITKVSLDARAQDATSALDVTTYGLADGLRSVEANGGQQPAAWAARDGTFWFPTTTGIAGIHPDRIRLNTLLPPVVIEGLRVDNETVPLSSEVVLPPGSDKLAFAYTALSLVAPETVRFRYRLDGHDGGWYDAGTRREAFYTNLEPGTYTLRVQASNNDGIWSPEGDTITFRIEPFFWQTAWFLVLCGLALAALIFGGYTARVKQLKAQRRHLEQVVETRTRDLREEKEHVEQAKGIIEAQADQLQDLDRFKTRFFANISHEFRTPLTLMLGPLENLLGDGHGPLSEPVRGQLATMQRNALRLLRLINQLLDLSRLESGKMDLRVRPRNVAQLAEQVVLSFCAFTEQRGIDLTLDAPADEVELHYEVDKLEKVLFNLLSNAVKFTPSGGRIAMVVSEHAATDDAPDGWVHLAVADTGRGIPSDKLALVFDRFRQAEESDSRAHDGSGIGLSMVRELVTLHRGDVSVESTVGEGTTFTVRLKKGTAHFAQHELATDLNDAYDEHDGTASLLLPTEELASPTPVALPAPDTLPEPLPADAPTVLIVDDNADIRSYVASCIGDTYHTLEAVDGLDGLEKARAYAPDVIISDIMMPRLDGNGLVQQLKSDADLRHIPVILLSAKTSQETIITGLEHGADEYLAKPFNARELRVRLRNLVTLRQQERELKTLNDHLEERVEEQVEIILSERRAYLEAILTEKGRTEQALQFRTTLMDNMSHEFRTPLTAIIGYAEILEAETEYHLEEFSSYILRGGRRLLRTLTALIELAKIESDEAETVGETVSVGQEIERIAATYRPVAAERGLAFAVTCPPEPVRIVGDRSAIGSIVDSLVDNAMKFTKAGRVEVRLTEEGQEVVLRVQDTGRGMDASFLPCLFEAFQQESDGIDREFEGVGLSLTLAHRYAELLHGTIEVETEKGQGSTFTVRLPLAPAPTDAGGDGISRPGASVLIGG